MYSFLIILWLICMLTGYVLSLQKEYSASVTAYSVGAFVAVIALIVSLMGVIS